MCVPRAAAPAAMEKLHEAHASLDQSPRDQTLFAERFRFRLLEAVELARRRRFLFELQSFGNGSLHLKCQLIRLDARAQVFVVGIIDAGDVIELADKAEVLRL